MALTKRRVLLAMLATLATSSWAAAEYKSYSNARFGFAFDYPVSWSLSEKQGAQSAEPVLSVKLLSPDENVPVRRDYSPGSVSIEVYANPNRKPLRAWLDERGWPFDAAGRSVTETNLGGLPALEVATGKMFAPNRFTYVASHDWVLRLSALAPDSQVIVQSIRFKQ